MKHVLVTGGAGFIGSFICDALLEKGYAVTAIDNLVTGQRENLEKSTQSKWFHFLNQDISLVLNKSEIPFLEKWGLHGVLHFACPASPIDFEKIPIEILKVDSFGTAFTVDLALKYGARYILASTSEVYGDPEVHPQLETYWGNVNTLGPRACYDETKRFAEAYVSSARRTFQLNSGIVRIFNTYGPRMRCNDGRIVPEMCMQALQGRPLTVHGDGSQTRSFCYVSDLVAGVILLFESSYSEPVNLGNPLEMKVMDFVETLSRLSGSVLKTEFLPGRVDDPRRRCPDIQRAKSVLNWDPKVDLTTGLRHCLEYFKRFA